MRENLNAIKRLVAFTLTVLLLGTTIWNDVFVIATEENHCSEYVDEQTYAANILQPVGEGDGYCDHCGQVEQAHVHVEEEPVVEEDAAVEEVQPAEELPAEEPVEDISVPEEPQPEIESTEEAVPINDEEIVPEDTPVIDEETPEENIETLEENIENPEEEIVEEEECEHEWTYTSNGDGTHVKKCSKCDEESTEDCVFGEDGKCIHCGYEKEEECEHEWEYISNNDGTHIKRCKKCGEEVTETCQLDENGICHDCLYEDERLMYQEFSKTIHGVKVTVAGDMPRGAKATIFAKPLEKANRIINENIDEGSFSVLDVFDIDIYKRSGEKYQPSEDGNTVEVSFIGISELTEVDDEDVVVYRIEEDESVTEISSDVVGAGVYFDAEHFSQYIVGTKSSSFVMLASYQHFATIREATGNIYTRVLKAKFDIQAMTIGEVYTFNAYVYKNLIDDTDPTSGTLVASAMNVPITVSNQLEGVIEIDLSNSTNGYIAAGEKYSIVVECTNDLISVGYGTQKDTTYDAPTYIYDGSSWERASENDEIFYIVVGDTIELSDKTDDNYVIDSIVAANGKADENGYYHYSKGDTDTLTAIIKDASNNVVDRDVTWSVPAAGSSVLTVDSKGNIKAIGVGNVDVTASYVNSTGTVTKSVKIYVLSFTIDGWDPDGIASQADTAPLVYTGSPITPAVVAYDGSGSTVSVDTAFDKNTDAGSKANVTISYSTNGKTYTYVRYFTISQAAINNAAYFASATLDPGTGKINGISAVNGYKPVQDTDFTATIGSPTASAAGIEYNVEIVGKGNFKDNYTWTKTLTGMDISTILTAKLTSQGLNLKDYTYTGDNVVLTTDTDGAWKEVAFYNEDNEQIKNIINPTNATYKITDYGGTEESASKAGKKTITFTMNSGTGYKGSIQVDFDINQRSMLETSIKWNHNNVENNNKFDHTGSPITVVPGTDFDVFYGSKKLTPYDESKSEAENKNADYKMSYIGDRTKIDDTPMIRVTAVSNGNYMLYNQSSFLIVPCYRDLIVRINDGSNHDGTINNNYVTGYNEYFDPNQKSKYFATTDSNYDATENSPNIKVVLEGMQIVEGTDYGADYKVEVFDDEDCTQTLTNSVSEGGTKYILVSPIPGGKFDGKDPIKASYIVEKTPLNTLKVTYNSNVTRTFTGKEQKVTASELIIKQGTTTLTPGTDYEIKYYNNTNAGTATFDIVGKGNYTGTLSNTSKYKFTIAKASMADGNTDGVVVGLDETKTYPYNGKVYMPKVKLSIVKDGVTTFTETIDPALNNSLATDNFTVEYDQSPSPGPKNVIFKATANGNFKDLVVKTALFTVGTNTANYSIFVTGANGVNQAVPMPTGHEVTDASGKITRYYYLDSNFVTYYTGATQACGIRVVDSEGQELKKNKDYGSYYNPSTSVNAYVKQVSEYTTSSTPHIVINGIGSYKNNNAIVYFNIQPKPISETIITPDDIQKLDYDSAAPVVPNYTLKNGSTTLLIDTDYTVSIYDVDLETGTRSDDPDKQKAAGKKVAVIEGKGNYTGTVEKEYYVGINVEDYASLAMTNPFDASEAFPKASTGYQIRWSNGHAPIITMTWKRADNVVITESFDGGDGTSNPDGTYVTFSPVASITASGMGLYDSRAPKNKDKEFNEITLTVAARANTQFYGSTEVKYTIMPVSVIDTSANQYKVTWSGSRNCDYTGADIVPALTGKYKYGTETEHSYTLTENDYYFDPEKISKDKTPGTPVPVKINGWGNFDEDETARFLINKGDVRVFLKPDTGEKAGSEIELQLDPISGSTDTSARKLEAQIKSTDETYVYKKGDEFQPHLIVKDKSGSNVIYDSSVEKTAIKYYNYNKPGAATAVISIPNTGNYIWSEITVKYNIDTNDINQTSYTVALNDLPYEQKEYTAERIWGMVKANKNLLKVKSGSTLLNFAESEDDATGDYVIITDEDDADFVEWKTANGSVALYGTNSLPSYSTTVDGSNNYIFIKGINAFSGVRKVPFNIILDITKTIVTVNTNAARYNLDENGENPTVDTDASKDFDVIIKYKDLANNYVELTGDNYTIRRSRDKLPGPDANVTVVGKNACKGERTNVRPEGTSDPPVFLVDLAVYKGISIKGGTVYHYTGSTIDIRFNGLEDAEYNSAISSIDGDYSIIYTTEPSMVDKQNADIDVGKWYAIIQAKDNSKYFKKGSYSNTATKENYAFYIKYYLPDAVFSFTGGSVVSHTGSTITIPAVIKTADGKHDLYDYSDPSKNTLVKLDRTTATDMGTYNIVASAKDAAAETYVEGTLTGTFKVSGSAIGDDNVALKDPNQANVIFKGSAFTPEVVVTVPGRSTPLTKDVDYTVEYMNNVHVGKATVLVKGKNNYEGTGTVHFNISAANISACDITPEDAYFSGYFINQSDQREVVPVETEVTVKNGTYTLTKDSEYTLSYNLHNMGITDSAEVTVNAAGNDFTGSKKVTYKILPLDLGDTSKVTVKQGTTTTEYTGSAVDPRDTVKVIVGDGYLCSNKEDTTTYDYTITISDGAGGDNLPSIKERGTYYLVITGAHNCTGSTAVPFIITEKSLPNNWHYFYSTPDFVGSKPVYHSNVPEGETPYYDYTPNYTFTDANGNTKSDTIRIVIHDVPTLTAEEANPVLQIFDTAISTTTPLTLGTDYEIKNPKNNTKAGTAAWYRGDGIDSTHAKPTDDAPQLTISGLGNYSGEITIPYNIGKNINNLEGLEVEYTFNGQTLTYNDENKDSGNNEDGTLLTTTYNGAEQKPTAKVYLKKGTEKQLLYPTKDYELTYENANTGEEDDSINAGFKYVVITGIGTYCGKISQKYTIKKKAITTSHDTFTTEELSVRANGKEVVAMEIKGTVLSRIPTEAKAKELLYPDLIANENDCKKYVGYFYAVYDGKPVKPELGKDIFVYDRTLSSEALTDEIDPKDLEIDYNGKSDTVASFEDGELINYSEMTIKFAQDKTDYVTNYFATGNDAGGTSSTSYTIRYLILQRDVSSFTVEYDNGLDDKQYKYDEGKVKTPSLTVRSGDQILKKDIDYEIAKAKDSDGVYYDMASPGEQKVLVKGINHYRGEIPVTYYIWGDLSQTNAYDSDMSNGYSSVPIQIYTGVGPSVSDELTIALVLLKQNAQKKDIVLMKGTHYSLKSDYSDDNFFYSGEVTYKGNEDKYWTGEKTIKYLINFDESKVKPTCDGTKEKYTSYPIRPEIKLNVSTAEFDESSIKYYRDTNDDGIGDVEISEDKDFIDPGYITVEVPYKIGGKAAKKPATGTYHIIPRSMIDCELVVSSRYRYTGSMIKPNVVVFINPKDGNDIKTLTEGVDYDVTYGGTNIDNIKNVGKVTVTGKTDKITGKKSKTFSIDVGQVAGLTATPVEGTSNAIKATWVKDIFTTGAELMLYKMSGSIATAVKINNTNSYTAVVSGNTTAFVFENLENVTNYKIAVRSYIDGTEKMYSEYSFAYATTGISTTSMDISQPSANMVTITWDDTGSAKIYKIYRYKDSEGKASAKKLASYPASTEGYTNIVDEPGVYWYYIVGYTILDGQLKPTQESEHKKVTITL